MNGPAPCDQPSSERPAGLALADPERLLPTTITWKTGFEIELLAPPGVSRRDLAERVARRSGGTVRRFFHPQSEPSAAPGRPLFENLTPGFAVRDKAERAVASFVDDLTLQADLDRQAAPLPGWHRIVADDARLLRLVMRHCDPDASGEAVLDPLAALFGTKPQRHDSGMVRVVDDRGASVAICAPLPGERERPCEIVTAPIERGHRRVLAGLLADARKLGFGIPIEGATHIHFDAAPLCSALVIARLVLLLERHGAALRELVEVNPRCIRLGPWPAELGQLVRADSFRALRWPDAQAELAKLALTKYCDFNLCNLVAGDRAKHTFEVRVLPASLDASAILAATALFEAILRWCAEPGEETPPPETLAELLARLPLARPARAAWLGKASARTSGCQLRENLYPFQSAGA